MPIYNLLSNFQLHAILLNQSTKAMQISPLDKTVQNLRLLFPKAHRDGRAWAPVSHFGMEFSGRAGSSHFPPRTQ